MHSAVLRSALGVHHYFEFISLKSKMYTRPSNSSLKLNEYE